MGKKYIIELLDDCPSEFKGIIVFGLTPEGQISAEPIPVEDLTPYTEPDLHEVRKKAYEKGYHDAAYNCHEGCNFLDDAKKKANEEYRRGYADCEAHYKAMVQDSDTTEGADAYQRGLTDAWEAARKIGSNSMCSLKEMGFDFSRCVVADYNPSWFVVKNYSASECIEKIRQYEQEKDKQARIEYNYEEIEDVINTTIRECNVSLDEIAEVLRKMKEVNNE